MSCVNKKWRRNLNSDFPYYRKTVGTQVYAFLACVVGGFFGVFSVVDHEVRFCRAKAEMRTKKETMGEGARGEGPSSFPVSTSV